MNPHLDSFGLNYLNLVLEIHAHHIDGYVDAYYGPPALKAETEAAEPKTTRQLLAAVQDLQQRIPDNDPARQEFLAAALRGIECTIRMLNGEKVDYLDEVYRLYDIRPQLVDETHFEAAHRQLDRLLPPGTNGNDLDHRLQSWRKRFEIDTEKALPLLERAHIETRRRTVDLIDLPNDKGVDIKLVTGQPWGAYNWYLGDGRSLIEFNTDMPLQAPGLIGTFAHEGYPGHHTEHLLKEKALYREKGYAEQAAMLLHSPAAVIAEGIATTALEMIYPPGDHHEWTAVEIFPAAGLTAGPDVADQLREIENAARPLRYINGNAAILYHTGQLNEAQTIEYIQTYALATSDRAAKSFNFISHPLYRSYIFTYSHGYDLIAATADPKATFLRLLTKQVLPSRLAAGH